MGAAFADFRHAIRIFRRAPGFSLAVVGALALGIGANSAIFSALDQTVIRPLPYREPARLAMLWEDFSAFGVPKSRVSPATFLDWRKRTRIFEQVGAYGGPRNMDMSGAGPPEEVLGLSVTANLLPMLGVSPLVGRTFLKSEEGPETKAVVLSYRLWQRRFGGEAGLVGKTVLMNGERYTVLGIMPRGFTFPDRETELWMPLGLSPQVLARRNSHFLKVVGRIRRGHTLVEARAEMAAIAGQMEREFPATNSMVGIAVVPLKDQMLGDTRTAFVILLAAAACVLLIACANAGNLLLVRASARRPEFVIRIALGARPLRLVRQILTENLVLALAGGGLGMLFASWGIRALEPMVPSGFPDLRLDLRAIAFTGGISILTGLLFGLAPALRFAAGRLAGRGTIGGGARRLRDTLVVAEVAIALVLVAGAALLIETMVRLRAADPGFRSDGILTADVAVPYPKYADSGKRRQFYSEILRHVRSIPGVKAAGLTSDLPYTSRGNTMGLVIEGRPAQPGLGQDALFRLVSAGYLETIGARLKEGRFLGEGDRGDTHPVVVVSESLARQYWPGESALGHRIDTGTGDGTRLWMTIVGVVADIRERGLDFGLKPAVYVPFTQTAIGFFQPSEIAVLTSREPLSLAKELQQAVWSVDPEQPVARMRPMSAIVDDEFATRRQVLEMLGAFAALSLLLAALGIYAVLSYVVSQKTREIGLRMAIGASQWDVVRSIGGYAARLTAAGLCAGVLLAAAGTRLLSTLLYGVTPLDPRTFAAVTAGLAMVALLASYLPARRAAAVDPAIALRQE
jgi:putative ABC transport system permease protein